MAPVQHFERPVQKVKRKKTFKSFWMTTNESFATVTRVETETAKIKKLTQKMMTKWKKRLLL